MTRVLPIALLAAGCAPVAEPHEDPVPPPASTIRCVVEPASALLGHDADPGSIEGVRRATGARTVRVIRPGAMVSQDYREDRLNLELTADGRVRRAYCG